ncbi:MAG: pentapeptide repeat-containing protein [Thomasclavelia sp.]|uniref:pentapeptide repeat-containing protein n=1 Tax=Thomasclavelia sp. TaxID=3025757 RepID=UPI00399FEC8D
MDTTKEILQLKTNCSQCSGLCCTALFFFKIDGFPKDKKAGQPCHNLLNDFRCKIHTQLKEKKLKGCIGYDCFGAGQYVTQYIYQGQTYKDLPNQANEIFDVFIIVFQLFQIRYYLLEVLTLDISSKRKDEIKNLIIENKKICSYPAFKLANFNIKVYKDEINPILKQICLQIRGNKKSYSTFLAKNFKGEDMSGLDLSMKLLIAANFNSCKFDNTIFLGADTRDTDFSNADLKKALFLTQGQVNSARGNLNTKLPSHLSYPMSWK